MNFDEFEEKLRRQPRREIPANWREEILGPLRAVETARPAPWWRQWLWPHPAAWGGLAAAWVAIFVLAYAGRPEHGGASVALSQRAPDVLQAFEERTRLMAELSGEVAEPRPPAERPRSARRVSQVVV
jgi:hypothetical protein